MSRFLLGKRRVSPHIVLEQLEARIVLDGEVTGWTQDADGVWHATDADGWDYYWYDNAGTEYYFRYDDTGQWWKDSNDMWEGYPIDVWETFGDPGANPDFIYDGRWHDLGAGQWYLYDLSYGHWWDDASETVNYFRFDYGAGQWEHAINGDYDDPDWKIFGDPGASSQFVYDGEWHEIDGQWFKFDDGQYGYWWSEFGGKESYFAHDYRTGQWWRDTNGYYQANGWVIFGDTGASSLFVYDGDWYETASGLWYRYDGIGDDSYLWHNDGTETYLAYEHDTGQWWEDTNGYYVSDGWVTVGGAGAETPFMFGASWTYTYDDANQRGEWTDGTDQYRYEYSTGERQWFDRVDDSAWEAFQNWFDDAGTDVFNDWAISYYDDGLGFYDFQDHDSLEWGKTVGGIDYYVVYMNELGATDYTAGFRNEIIYGTAGDDTINAWNRIYQYWMFGGDGIDSLWGGYLDDSLYCFVPDSPDPWMNSAAIALIAGDGKDSDNWTYGGAGNDAVVGGHGTDRVHGDNGNDTIYGGNGNDIMYGDIGNDTIYGGNGRDRIWGDSYGQFGNDTLHGGDGDDLIFGDGEDSFGGGSGNDIIYGDAGDDEIHGDTSPGSYLPASWGDDLIFGGEGNDLIFGDNQMLPGNGDDEIYGGVGEDLIIGDSGSEWGSGNDTIDGEDDDDTIYGDSITGGGDGIDILFGGDGNDTIIGDAESYNGAELTSAGRDEIHGGPGDDTLLGDAWWGGLWDGDDIIFGDAGHDLILGDSYYDMYYSGGGRDIIYAGTGNDEVFGDAYRGGRCSNDEIHGGPGNDILVGDLSQSSAPAGSGGWDLIFGDEDDDILYGDFLLFGFGLQLGFDYLIGGTGNDTIYGDAYDMGPWSGGNDDIYGGPGSDTLFGDSYTGSAGGDDYIYGGDPTDAFNGDQDTIYGGSFEQGLGQQQPGDVVDLDGPNDPF